MLAAYFMLISVVVFGQNDIQNTKNLSRKERKKEIKERDSVRQEQRKQELYGFINATPNVTCYLQSGAYHVAVLPFDVDSSKTSQAGKIHREYFESYLSQLGWTVIGKERTDKYLSSLQKLVDRNVLDDDEIRNIKEMVGADVFVTGTVTDYYKGISGSGGTHVSFTVNCQLIETSCRKVWGGTVESRSGAYNYDTSPTFLLNDAMKQFFENLKAEIAKCNNNEKE